MAAPVSSDRPEKALTTKTRATFGELGLLNTALYSVDRLFVGLKTGIRLFRYYLVAQPVPPETDQPVGRAWSMTIREINRSDRALTAIPVTPEVLDYRFSQAATCLGAFKGEELVAYLWLCLGPYEEDEVRCRFVPGPKGKVAWDFDVYVMPEHRLSRAFAFLWREANAYLRARGIAWTISRISAFNPGSLASHRRMGASRLGSAIFVRRKNLQLLIANVKPYICLTFGEKTRPVIQLDAPDRPTMKRDLSPGLEA